MIFQLKPFWLLLIKNMAKFVCVFNILSIYVERIKLFEDYIKAKDHHHFTKCMIKHINILHRVGHGISSFRSHYFVLTIKRKLKVTSKGKKSIPFISITRRVNMEPVFNLCFTISLPLKTFILYFIG